MQMVSTRAPARARQERPSLKAALTAAGKLSQLLPVVSAKIGGLEKRLEWTTSDSPGFLLLDASRQPLFANDEAISILTYPEEPPANGHLCYFLMRKMDALLREQNGSWSKVPIEITSGKRLYRVRAFMLKSHLTNRLKPGLAVLLERKGGHVDVWQAARKFHLTHREAQALELLMQGGTTKQIASRMNISPNTAKAFLRSVMFKSGAPSRSGILAKILQLSEAGAAPACLQ